MGFNFMFSDVEGCAAASDIINKDGYSIRYGDNDGDGAGMYPLFLLNLSSGNKLWRNTSDVHGVLFSFSWCRSDRCGSDYDAYEDGKRQLSGGGFIFVDILTSASECEHDFCFYILISHLTSFSLLSLNFRSI